ncbi:hypothetical protein [Modestobacter roseus]|uniref:hypothetical protein n=1 Tax=Modestobacter roseus TaxID=1181884 RepID=UPI0012949CC0|nr:hypothetical protein [Modestobacter roseus]MQA34024.1 hypothetical protein [Modestobacter roseus]
MPPAVDAEEEAVAGGQPAAEAVATGPPEGGGSGRQALWTVVDQVLSSVANFGLTIAVAREVDQVAAGAFAYAFLVLSFGLGVSRAISTDPLVIRFSAASAEARARAVTAAAGAMIMLGLVAGLVCALAGVLVGDVLGAALLLLVLVMPGQFVQDSWRSAAFASRNARRAAANDAVRVVVQFSGLGLCAALGVQDLRWFMVAWAVGAWTAGLFGMWQFRAALSPRASVGWLRSNAGLSVRLGAGYAINMGAVTLTTTLLTGMLGLVATGGLRFAQTVLGPMQVAFGALTSFMIPLLARRLAARGARTLLRPAVLVSAGATTLCVLVVTTLLLLPSSVGEQLLGSSWAGAREVMAPVGVGQCLVALALGGSLPLLAMGRGDLMLRVTSVQAPLLLGFGLGGAALAGISGAAWGMAAAQAVGCVLVLVLGIRAMRSGDVRTAPADEPAVDLGAG